MKLFICEKPSQARDIAPHVGAKQRGNGCMTGDGVAVTWCIGHLLEQAKPEHYAPALTSWDLNLLPVVPTQWHMDVKPSTREQYQVVARLLKQAREVVIATDADREGEVIAREVMQLAGYGGPIRRLWLGALDSASIRKALAGLLPDQKTKPLYFSGMGRARADWLAGMNMTMALTAAFGTGGKGGVLHCGRVQTPVLALIVRREREILNFKPKAHYVLQASFEVQGTLIPMRWKADAARLDKDGHCVDRSYVDGVATKVRGRTGRVSRVEKTRERELAPLLYSLGSLQREASARYGLKAQAVLDACQALYETHKATTYPRTDCEHLPESMAGEVPQVLQALRATDPAFSKLIERAVAGKPGRAFNDKKVTAHHAIIPTANPTVKLVDMKPTERMVYDLIRRRYIAQFLGDREFNRTVMDVACEGEAFTATGEVTTVPGWKLAYAELDAARAAVSKPDPADQGEGDGPPIAMPAAAQGDQAINRKADTVATKTKPPKRYTEGTLLAAMESIDKIIDDPRLKKVMQSKEKAGIGTDATRSSIIEGLFKREYIANEKKFIVPTDRGTALIGTMEQYAPALADPVLTALWEDQLMQIESGALKLEDFERSLGQWLADLIGKIRPQARPRVPRAEPTGPVHACPACGKPMRPRSGSTGAFWGCSAYPGCKTTLPDAGGRPGAPAPRPSAGSRAAPASPLKPGDPCPSCRKGRVQLRNLKESDKQFWGCSEFPGCKLFQWAQ